MTIIFLLMKIYTAHLYLTGNIHCIFTSSFLHPLPELVFISELVWMGYVM